MFVIGIDPGTKTGIACFKEGKLIRLLSKTPLETITFLLNNASKIKVAVIEDSKGQSHLFSAKKTQNKRVVAKIGRNVGEIDALCKLYLDCFRDFNIELIKVTPLKKGDKWKQEDFIGYFPDWKKRTNEHERDAVKIVYKYNYHLIH